MSKESEVLDNYLERIDNLVEVDYGDFKRKLGQYIIRLEENLESRRNPEITKTLKDLRMRVLYQTNANIEACRDLALEKIRHLKTALPN